MPQQSSSSAASDVGINSPTSISINQPNYLAWMVIGVGLILLAFVLKRKKKKS